MGGRRSPGAAPRTLTCHGSEEPECTVHGVGLRIQGLRVRGHVWYIKGLDGDRVRV